MIQNWILKVIICMKKFQNKLTAYLLDVAVFDMLKVKVASIHTTFANVGEAISIHLIVT